LEIEEYINSGSLEQYCFELFNADLSHEVDSLSVAHPEVKQELNEIENAIEMLAKSQAIAPDPKLKDRIFAALNFHDEQPLDINNLPPTSKYANHTQWLKAVEHLIPTEPFEDFFAAILQQTDHIAQTLVITRLNVPEEIHTDVKESFFILKGQCACTVGNEVFTLNAGDYLDIPLHVNHDIKILSPYVIGVLQHQF